MMEKELVKAIYNLIELELTPEENADKIEALSLDIIKNINEKKIQVDQIVYRYIDDFDLRRKDPLYGEYQRLKILNILRAT